MAVMLRTLGIPSRVVTGFTSGEFNDITGNYVVRARNAHAWVEAYFFGYGWITFDPTPGGGVATPQGWARAMLYLDAASSFWREWVISYDSSHQYFLGQTFMTGTRGSFEQARWWTQLHYARMLSWAKRKQAGADGSPTRWFWLSATGALLLGALPNTGRILRAIRTWRLRTNPQYAPQLAAAVWYEKMARYLARRGVQKSPTQTAREFVRLIEDEPLRSRVGEFTNAYESARFGDSAEEAQKLPELYEQVEMAAKK